MWFFGKKKKSKSDEDIEYFKIQMADFLMREGCMSSDNAINLANEFANKHKKKLGEVC